MRKTIVKRESLQLRSRSLAIAVLAAWPMASSLGLGCAIEAEPQRLGFTDDLLIAANNPQADVTPADFVGRWQGEAHDLLELGTDPNGAPPLYRFPSGSSQITLDIQIDEFGSLVSTLVFGAAALPEATDAFASFPPGAVLEDYDESPASLEGALYHLLETPLMSEIAAEDRVPNDYGSYVSGPDVSLADADGILRFAYATSDAYGDWCRLQPALPSVVDGPHIFNCLGAHGVAQAADGNCYAFDDSDDFYPLEEGRGIIADPARLVDCARAFACMDQCVCYDPEHEAKQGFETPPDYTPCSSGGDHYGALSIRQLGDELIGVLSGDAGFVNARGARTTLGQVRFRRVPD